VSEPQKIGRRALAGAVGTLLLGGCDRIEQSQQTTKVLSLATALSRRVQGVLAPKSDLAPEYTEADLSPDFRGNGTVDPDDFDYQSLVDDGFKSWRLQVDGLVQRPAKLSLAELRARPSRTQITRHDCVEGWSCIGKWKGAILGDLLNQVGLQPRARYVVFHCADPMDDGAGGTVKYYESLDIREAMHPQTILAYDMNDATLSVRHGAPLRLRVERQLGYKMAKYVMRVELVDSFAGIGAGHGGYWEDFGYAWYAGI
jgi:DMSO/TMAO reductase YedYZ molybdopterin-dependent catalytic subunit